MAILDNIISWWTFDETTGTRADSVDSNGAGVAGTVGETAGKVNGCATFPGSTSDFLFTGVNSNLEFPGTSFSVALWVYFNTVTTTQTVFAKNVNPANASCPYALQLIGASSELALTIGNNTTFTTLTATTFGALSVSTWYFVVCGYDSTSGNQWISINNGTAQTVASVGPFADAGNLRFGRGSSPLFALNGHLDEGAIWARSLGSTDISTLWNGGAGVNYADLTKVTLDCAPGSLTVTASPAAIMQRLDALPGSFVVTASPIGLVQRVVMSPGSFDVTTTYPVSSIIYLYASPTTFRVTASPVAIVQRLDCSSGSFAVTGYPCANPHSPTELFAGPGAFTATTSPVASVERTPALTARCSVTGVPAIVGLVAKLQPGTYTAAPSPIGLVQRVVMSPAGVAVLGLPAVAHLVAKLAPVVVTVTGYPTPSPPIHLDCGTGVFMITPSRIGIRQRLGSRRGVFTVYCPDALHPLPPFFSPVPWPIEYIPGSTTVQEDSPIFEEAIMSQLAGAALGVGPRIPVLVKITTTGSTNISTLSVPAGVDVLVEILGTGGGGAGAKSGGADGGGGGGGGAYASATVPAGLWALGGSFEIGTAGTGGAAAGDDGSAGGDSTLTLNSVVVLTGGGGGPGLAAGGGGAGGVASTNGSLTNAVLRNGTAGTANATTLGGPGGAGAGGGGGAGGTGGTGTSGAGGAGSVAGGGGGGGAASAGVGGAGAAGYVRVSWVG